jgi:hypothetical protein
MASDRFQGLGTSSWQVAVAKLSFGSPNSSRVTLAPYRQLTAELPHERSVHRIRLERSAALLCKPRRLGSFDPPQLVTETGGDGDEPAAWTVVDSKAHAGAGRTCALGSTGPDRSG